MTTTSLDTFLGKLRNDSRSDSSKVQHELTTFTSDIPSLQKLINGLTAKKLENGYITINGLTVGQAYRVLSEGNFNNAIAQFSVKNIKPTAAEATKYAEITKKYPESLYYKLRLATLKSIDLSPSLNVNEDAFKNASSNLNTTITRLEKLIMTKYKNSEVVKLTFGTFVAKAPFLVDALRARKGCYMFTQVDGNISSCKVSALTCSGVTTDKSICDSPNLTDQRNRMLELIAIADAADTDDLKLQVAAAADIKPENLKSSLNTIVDAKFNQVYTILAANEDKIPKITNICSLKNDTIEQGVIPTCRACSPSANPMSTMYLDPDTYDNTMSFECVANPTMLELLADIELVSGLTLIPKDEVKPANKKKITMIIAIVAAIIAIIIIIVVIVIVLANKKTNASTMVYDRASAAARTVNVS